MPTISLSVSLNLPPHDSGVRRYRSRWSWRITPGVGSIQSWLSWIVASTSRYPAISSSSRVRGSARPSTMPRSRASVVRIPSMRFEAPADATRADSTRAPSAAGSAERSEACLPLHSCTAASRSMVPWVSSPAGSLV